MAAPRDPEARAHHREHANWGNFEIVIKHDEHGELGTLDDTFDNDFDAGMAAHNAAISDVGISTEVRETSPVSQDDNN